MIDFSLKERSKKDEIKKNKAKVMGLTIGLASFGIELIVTALSCGTLSFLGIPAIITSGLYSYK